MLSFADEKGNQIGRCAFWAWIRSEQGKTVTDLLEPSQAGQRRRRAVALSLWVLALVLLAIAAWWWLALPDEDPGEPIIKDVAEEASEVAR